MAVLRIYWVRAMTRITSTILEKSYISKTKRKEAATVEKRQTKKLKSRTQKEFKQVATQHPLREELVEESFTTETVILQDTKDTRILITKDHILITLQRVALDILQGSRVEKAMC